MGKVRHRPALEVWGEVGRCSREVAGREEVSENTYCRRPRVLAPWARLHLLGGVYHAEDPIRKQCRGVLCGAYG